MTPAYMVTDYGFWKNTSLKQTGVKTEPLMGLQRLTVQPVLIVGFSSDVMLTAALDRRTEDRSVGSHEVHRGSCIEFTT